jgi:putative flippase GtrA
VITLRSQRQAGEIVRFAIVGASSVAFNNLLIVALTELASIHYLVSIVIAFLLATGMGFALNRQWTFGKAGSADRSEFARYLAVTLGGIGISLLATWYLMRFGIPYYVTMVGIGCLMAPMNFVAHRVWSFALGFGISPEEPAR